jgi:hypothetical protein
MGYYRLDLYNRIKRVLADGRGDHKLHRKYYTMDKTNLLMKRLKSATLTISIVIIFGLFFCGCENLDGYDSISDKNWARTLKHAYQQGLIGGANAANETSSFEILKLQLFKDSVEYAKFIDSVFKE